MRYGELLSQLRAFEALALYYENLVLCKAREMDEYLAEIMGTPINPLAEPVETPPEPEPVQSWKAPPAPPGCVTLDDYKQSIIANCLLKHHGNIRKAARELGISRNIFYRGLRVNGE